MRALTLCLYTLKVEDLEKVLKVQEHVMVLNVTLEVEPGEEWKKKFVKALESAKGLEQVEVVANPTLQFFMEVCAMIHVYNMCCDAIHLSISIHTCFCRVHADVYVQVQNPRHGVMKKTFPSDEDLNELSKKLEKLSSFKVNILRATSFGTVDYERKDGKWVGGVTEGKGLPAAPS